MGAHDVTALIQVSSGKRGAHTAGRRMQERKAGRSNQQVERAEKQATMGPNKRQSYGRHTQGRGSGRCTPRASSRNGAWEKRPIDGTV